MRITGRHENGGMLWRLAALIAGGLLIAACSSSPDYRGSASTAKGGGVYKVGNPYKVAGRWYYPKDDKTYNKVGIASWYGPNFHGRKTANGERYDMNELTAAHTTLPMPSYVRVTNLENGRFLILRINDRGPFVGNRIIDVSRRAAQLLGFEKKGTARVRVEAVTPLGDSPVREVRRQEGPKVTITPTSDMPAVPAANVESARLAPPSGTLRHERAAPVSSTENVFVQAGAFIVFHNAEKLANDLKNIGAVTLSKALVGGRSMFRVRIGPFASMEDADAILGQIVAQGISSARIVVD